MNNIKGCSGCCNLIHYSNGQNICKIFEVRTIVRVDPKTKKCKCYNYHTEDCACCHKPIVVDKEDWGYDPKDRTRIMCVECIKYDSIPNRRK